MTNDKPAMSAMYQRFVTIRAHAESPDTAPSGPWFEPVLLEILRRAVPPGQARDGHLQKEREIGELFARMSVADAMALHKRLTCGPHDDAVVEAFARLIEERRVRLIRFLGDARRRAAIGA